MDKQYFVRLLHKYLKGKSTFEERELLINYYNLFNNEPDVISLLSAERKEVLKKEIYRGIHKNIAAGEKPKARIRTLPGRLVTGAAAAVLVAAALTVVHFLNQKNFSSATITAQAPAKRQNRLLGLPDGSMVILSDGSKLDYPRDFGKFGTREVYLEGQAYFDIHSDSSRPFIVHTAKIRTTVLGTAFDVKDVKDGQDIIITVTRGKVEVSGEKKKLGLLIPGQQIVYNKRNGQAVKRKVDAQVYLQWKDKEDMMLDNVTFGETARLLEDKFGVTIKFNDTGLKKKRFTTVLLQVENLEKIIKSICDFNGAVWKYNRDSSVVIISNKRSGT